MLDLGIPRGLDTIPALKDPTVPGESDQSIWPIEEEAGVVLYDPKGEG